MSNTPAAQIARLKTNYPGWSIRQVQRGKGYTAHRRDGTGQMRKIYGSTPGELAGKLQAPSGEDRPATRHATSLKRERHE